MYTREIQPPRDTPVEKGIPLQGTWDKAFIEVNLLDILRPYRLPLPRWIRNCRIKEWQSLLVQDDRYFLGFFLGNAKFYRYAQILLFDREEGKKYLFRKLLPGGGWGFYGSSWRLPRSLANSSVYCRTHSYFFRIHSWLDADTIKLAINIEKNRKIPALTAQIEYNMGKVELSPMAVSLNFSGQRCMYAFKAMAEVRGDIVLGDSRINLNPARASGIFCDYKGFFPYRMREVLCYAMGFTDEGRRYGFHLGENQARETHRNNENALWIDGHLHPLPPVRITMLRGVDSGWIIQDVEGMVDLVFTPKETNNSGIRALVTRAEYDTPLGYYNGALVTSAGERLNVRNLWGMGEILNLRV